MAVVDSTLKPTTEPEHITKLQYTDLVGNNNKFWQVSEWSHPGNMRFLHIAWGRVGAKGQSQCRVEAASWVARKIATQTKEGYAPIALATAADVGSQQAPRASTAMVLHRTVGAVDDLVAQIYKEAGEQIKTYLATTIDKLGPRQIEKGRELIARAALIAPALSSNGVAVGSPEMTLVQDYFRAIPTKLPHKINPATVATDFYRNLSDYEQALDQVAAAVTTFDATSSGMSQRSALGVDFEVVTPGSDLYKTLEQMVRESAVHGRAPRVERIFEVQIPDERSAYLADTVGKSRRELLFHGTRAANVRHILKSGLIIPQSFTNGWNFGRGIYFAPNSTKSTQYASANHGSAMLMIAEVAVGKSYMPAKSADVATVRAAPAGHDSVWAKGGKTLISYRDPLKYDEVIVYRPQQQTIRYLVQYN